MLYAIVGKSEAAKLNAIGIEYHIISTLFDEDTIVGKRLIRVEIEDKDKVFTLESHELVALIIPNFLNERFGEFTFFGNQAQHRFIEAGKVGIMEVFSILERPLAAGVFIRPTVTLTREVDPLRMSELIAHKIEVTAIYCSEGNKANHLMESDTAIYQKCFITLFHMPIHIGVDKAENNCFIPHEGLVVRFGIGDGFLTGATIGHLIEDMACFPIFVSHLFDITNPEVRNTHCEAIVETDTAIGERHSEFRKSGHLFGNSDSIGFNLMDKFVSKSEIADSIAILIKIVIVAIIGKILAEAMITINHRSYAIKSESVEFILFKPEFTVRKQEV